jgi:hypothetical protein
MIDQPHIGEGAQAFASGHGFGSFGNMGQVHETSDFFGFEQRGLGLVRARLFGYVAIIGMIFQTGLQAAATP